MKEAIAVVAAYATALGAAALHTRALTRRAYAVAVKAQRGQRGRLVTKPSFARNFRSTCRVFRTQPGLIVTGHILQARARHMRRVSALLKFAHE